VEGAWLVLAWGVVPALMLVFLAIAIWRRGRSPLWLPVAAVVALLVLAVVSAAQIVGDLGSWWVPGLDLAWSLVALALLVAAAVAVARSWPSRGALVIAGLAIPAPLMAWLLAVVLANIADVG
jgi:hypothetical protein